MLSLSDVTTLQPSILTLQFFQIEEEEEEEVDEEEDEEVRVSYNKTPPASHGKIDLDKMDAETRMDYINKMARGEIDGNHSSLCIYSFY